MPIRLRESPSGKRLDGSVNGQVLTWNAAIQQWEPAAAPGGSIAPLTLTFYVDAGFVGVSNGSIAAPFIDIQDAINAAGANPVTIFVVASAVPYGPIVTLATTEIRGLNGIAGLVTFGPTATIADLTTLSLVDITLAGDIDSPAASLCNLELYRSVVGNIAEGAGASLFTRSFERSTCNNVTCPGGGFFGLNCATGSIDANFIEIGYDHTIVTGTMIGGALTAGTHIKLRACTTLQFGNPLTAPLIELDYLSFRSAQNGGNTFSVTPTIIDGPVTAAFYESSAANLAASGGTILFVPISTALFTEVFASPNWAFAAAGLTATYGPAFTAIRRYLVRVIATVNITGGASGTISAGIALNGDIVGLDPAAVFTGGTQRQAVTLTTGDILAERMVEVSPGDVVRAVFATTNGATPSDVALQRLTMAIVPAGP